MNCRSPFFQAEILAFLVTTLRAYPVFIQRDAAQRAALLDIVVLRTTIVTGDPCHKILHSRHTYPEKEMSLFVLYGILSQK